MHPISPTQCRLRQSGITPSRQGIDFPLTLCALDMYILVSKCTRVALRPEREWSQYYTQTSHRRERESVYIYIYVSMWSCTLVRTGVLVVRHNDQYIYDGSECVNRCRLLDQSGTRLSLSLSFLFLPPFSFLGSLSLSLSRRPVFRPPAFRVGLIDNLM